jgi:uncharacterized protein YndB with AHSA1/START domain
METAKRKIINIETVVHASPEKVWEMWSNPEHIVQWNNATSDWHTTRAENDLREGGTFLSRLEAKDGSSGFDFTGKYDKVVYPKEIYYTMDDGRRVEIRFIPKGISTVVFESFEAEDLNSPEIQESGWKSILDNFKLYVESYRGEENLYFQITIDASVDKVYKTMLDKKDYTEWTAEFDPTSHFIGSWEQESKMLFIGTDKDGMESGMVSWIKTNIPGKKVTIEHQGLYQNGKEILTGDEVNKWAGATEEYRFTDQGGKTLLEVELGGLMEYRSYFLETWPKALNKLKSICEQ